MTPEQPESPELAIERERRLRAQAEYKLQRRHEVLRFGFRPVSGAPTAIPAVIDGLTMTNYGDAMTPDMREASRKVAMLALTGDVA